MIRNKMIFECREEFQMHRMILNYIHRWSYDWELFL